MSIAEFYYRMLGSWSSMLTKPSYPGHQRFCLSKFSSADSAIVINEKKVQYLETCSSHSSLQHVFAEPLLN